MPANIARSRQHSGVQCLTHALEVLSCFTTDHPEWGVTELAEYLGFFKSAAYRYLQNFEKAGYVERTPDHRYCLGVQALELGNVYRFQSEIVRAAEEPIHDLSEQTLLSAHLAQLNGRDALELLRVTPSNENLRRPAPVVRKSAHASAVGKVLLGFGGENTFERFLGSRRALNRYTDSTICGAEQLRQHLDRVVEQGYGLDLGESFKGRHCVAVPVMNQRDRVIAAISISSSSEKINEGTLGQYLPLLWRTARSIQQRMR
ncbi:MAG: IclR family transcriptional regulator [Bryobacteraceae bacterium]